LGINYKIDSFMNDSASSTSEHLMPGVKVVVFKHLESTITFDSCMTSGVWSSNHQNSIVFYL